MAGVALEESSRICGGEAVCPGRRAVRAGEKRRAAGEGDRDAPEETGAAFAEVARHAAELPETRSVADARGRRQNGCGAGFRIRENQLAPGGAGGDERDIHFSAR